MESWISPRKPFGIESAFSKGDDFKETKDELHDVECLGKGLKVGYINHSQITAHQDWIDKLKVFMPYANNIGTELNDDNLNSYVGRPNEICTESYLVVGADLELNKNSAENLSKYFKIHPPFFII
mgnify:CR=1 FL=1